MQMHYMGCAHGGKFQQAAWDFNEKSLKGTGLVLVIDQTSSNSIKTQIHNWLMIHDPEAASLIEFAEAYLFVSLMPLYPGYLKFCLLDRGNEYDYSGDFIVKLA